MSDVQRELFKCFLNPHIRALYYVTEQCGNVAALTCRR